MCRSSESAVAYVRPCNPAGGKTHRNDFKSVNEREKKIRLTGWNDVKEARKRLIADRVGRRTEQSTKIQIRIGQVTGDAASGSVRRPR